MKTTKTFFMAALALMTAACSNDDNEFAQQPQKAEGITITATLAPKTAVTKAISDQTTYIKAEWAVNEHIAILYTKDETKYAADATITAVDGSGTATITFTVEAGTTNDTPCTLVYPLSAAKDDHTGVKDAATLLADQDGTLNANLDVRVGAGTIQTTTPGLTVTTQPAAQFAIFKFTVKNSDASATIDVKPLTVTIGAQDYVITPASATSELFAALPAISGEAVTFSATGSDSKTYTASKASVTFSAGYYYQSVIKMAESVPVIDLSLLGSVAYYELTGDAIITGTPTEDDFEIWLPGDKACTVTLDNVDPSGTKSVRLTNYADYAATVRLKGTSKLAYINIQVDQPVTIEEAAAGGTVIISSDYNTEAIYTPSLIIINSGTVKAKCDPYAVLGNLEVNGGNVYLAGINSMAVCGTISGTATLYGWDGSVWENDLDGKKYITTDNTSGNPTAWDYWD